MATTKIARALASQFNVNKLDPLNPEHITAFANYLFDNVTTSAINGQDHSPEDIEFMANADIGMGSYEENSYVRPQVFFNLQYKVNDRELSPLFLQAQALAYLVGYGGAGATTGIGPHVRRKIEAQKKLTSNEIKAFVNTIQWYAYDRDAWSFFLDWVLKEQEKDFFKVIDFEIYKFDVFDKKLVEYANEYLDGNPRITKLQKAVYKGGRVRTAFYAWQSEGYLGTNVPEGKYVLADRIDIVDPSLHQDTEANYKRPFRRLGRPGSKNEKRGINDVKFAEGSAFSEFKLLNVKDESTLFFTREKDKAFEYYKTQVIPSMVQYFRLRPNGVEWKYNEAQKVFDEHIGGGCCGFFEQTEEFTDEVSGEVDTKQSLPRLQYIAKRLLDVFRKAAFEAYARELHGKTQEELDKILGDISGFNAKIFAEAEETANNSQVATATPPERERPLSDSELEARQRFMKQCALMTRLGDLAAEHAKKGKARYNKRFYMVKDGNGDQHGIISKLLLPKADEISEFLEMKTAVHAFLVPKLRFYKVINKAEGLVEEEFQFRNFTSTSRIEDLLSSKFDRGGDYGIKEFSFTFEGSTPATARNDITANLSLFFQTFDDFITIQPENKSSFVDMLLLPGNSDKAGDTKHTTLQHNSEYYRIRVDVGWEIKSTEPIENLKGVNVKSLKKALQKTNKSFYLTMIDHTINFKDDGSVGIDVQYRAYMETALKSSGLDALSSHKTKKVLKDVSDQYKEIVRKGICSVAEENRIRISLLEVEDLLRKQSFQSIMQRLLDNNFIYFKKVASETDNNYQRTGFFTKKVKFLGEGAGSAPEKSKEKADKSKKKKTEPTLSYGADFFSEDLRNDHDHKYINYFFLGDLLYVVLDCLYQEANPKKYLAGFEKFKFILGSFEFKDMMDDNAPKKTINLASIPVSVEVFFEWFTENVIKPERKSYSVMYFIRDLCTYLIGEILTENCFKSAFDKKLQFKTTNFVGHKDPLASMKGTIIDVAKYYGAKGSTTLPLIQDSDKHFPIKDMTNYIMVYVDTPRITKSGDVRRGNKKVDGENGIYHFQIGKDRGLLKKMKFSKSDMKYVREARYFRHGFDGLMQLSNVYNVSLDMIGNTLYYPGMEVYINPLGFLGAKSRDWDPTRGAPSGNPSVANKLGFGGYHLVTRVKSSIGPGKFTTTVDAMFNYSGDGDPNSYLVGAKQKKKKITETDDKLFQRDAKCTQVYEQIVNQKLDLTEGQTTWDPIDFDMTKNTTPTAPVQYVPANPIVPPASPPATPPSSTPGTGDGTTTQRTFTTATDILLQPENTPTQTESAPGGFVDMSLLNIGTKKNQLP